MNTLLYHPSTAVFVDDQKSFLSALQQHLPPRLPAQFFHDPIQALEHIHHYRSSHQQHFGLRNADERLIELDEFDPTSDAYIDLCLTPIRHIASDLQRFAEPSVVIIDRIMPELDGLELCRQLKAHPIKKIMLTADTDLETAVTAFNEGTIDYFLVKDSPLLVTQLIHTIAKMQEGYFNALWQRKMGEGLITLNPVCHSPTMAQLYKHWMQKLHATELYLLDRWGSVLFITYEGIPNTLAVMPETMLDFYAAIAADQDEDSIAQQLTEREKLVFFPLKSNSLLPAIEWSSFLFPAHPVPDESGWFYSLITEQQAQPLRRKDIQPQSAFRCIMAK